MKEFVIVSESNALRSANAAVSDKELYLSRELSKSNLERKKLKRKVTGLEKEVEMVDISTANCDVALSHLDCAKKKVQQLESQSADNVIEKKYLKNLKVLVKTEAALEKANISNAEKMNGTNEKICEMKLVIKNLKKENKKLSSLNASLTSSHEMLDEEQYINLEQIRHEKHKLQKKFSYSKKRLEIYSAGFGDPKEKEILGNEIDNLEKEVKRFSSENKELLQLVSLLEKDEVKTFENGRYTNEVREVIMELLNLNVNISKINKVITSVLTKLGSKTIGRLPSAGVKSRILQESLILAQKQVGEAMLDGGISDDTGNTLHGDGTTKFHRHFQNFQITTKTGRSYSFGLCEVASGDVAATMNALCEAVDDLSAAINNDVEKDKNVAMLLSSIKSTMSDLGPVNPGFNTQLRLLRETLLPKAIDNWKNVSVDQKQQLTDMANFFLQSSCACQLCYGRR